MPPLPAFTAPVPCALRGTSRAPAFSPRRALPARAPRRRAVVAVASGEPVTAAEAAMGEVDGVDGVDVVISPGADVAQSSIQTLTDIEEIIALVDEFDLTDFRLADKGVAVEISRAGGRGFEDGKLARPVQGAAEGAVVYQTQEPGVVYEDEAVTQDEGAVVDVPAVEQGEPDPTGDPDTVYDSDFVVMSNRVGFFYSGAKNKPPLVNVGDHVDFNQPVCIIEQLGQQYVYLSEASGTVNEIFVEDGDAVEYDQQVMVIRPD